MARPRRRRATDRRRDRPAGTQPWGCMDDRVRWAGAARHGTVAGVPYRGSCHPPLQGLPWRNNRSARPGRWRRSSGIQVCSPNAVCPTLWAVVRSPIRSSCSRSCSVNRTESCRAGPRMACLSPAALRGASRTRTQAPRAPRLRQPTTGGGLRKACLRGVSCRAGIGAV